MDDTPTVSTLFSRYQKRLALQWVEGQEGSSRQLKWTSDTPGKSLVGHLNTIHPNRVQILGQLELDYLTHLSDASRHELLTQLYSARPAAIIVAERGAAELKGGCKELPAELSSMAKETQTPLLCSELASVKLVSDLHHFLGSELSEKTIVHGVFLEVQGMGVVLTGESGVGKSELALELITRNHRLIADDAPEFFRVGPDTVRGTCPDALRDFLEVRGLGILNVRAMYGDSAIKISKDLRLMIHLENMALEKIQQVDRLEGSYTQKNILDVEIPMVTLPVATGRNLAVLVEAAVRHHILLRKGYNASEAFVTRQQEFIQQQNL